MDSILLSVFLGAVVGSAISYGYYRYCMRKRLQLIARMRVTMTLARIGYQPLEKTE